MKKERATKTTRAQRLGGVCDKYVLELSALGQSQPQPRLIVWLQLPEAEQQRFDISLTGNVLTIKGEASDTVAAAQLFRPAIVGESRKLLLSLEGALLAASRDESVVICGETGTGKELFARAIHQNSRRAAEKFVIVDCRSIPELLAKKLLFGERRGPDSGPEGLLAQADGGTLFLDEVGDLPVPTQALFNKLLQEQSYRPLAAGADINTNFRLIVATNRDLGTLVKQGKFNPELFALLQPFMIEIPPLRERPEDIGLLTDFFLHTYSCAKKVPVKAQSPEFVEMLKKYPWPGNVRELENSLEQALLSAKAKKTLFSRDLPAHIRIQVARSALCSPRPASTQQSREPLFAGFRLADNPL